MLAPSRSSAARVPRCFEGARATRRRSDTLIAGWRRCIAGKDSRARTRAQRGPRGAPQRIRLAPRGPRDRHARGTAHSVARRVQRSDGRPSKRRAAARPGRKFPGVRPQACVPAASSLRRAPRTGGRGATRDIGEEPATRDIAWSARDVHRGCHGERRVHHAVASGGIPRSWVLRFMMARSEWTPPAGRRAAEVTGVP
jgi:hypothetical protein